MALTARRYRLDVAYDGSRFSGWQVQPEGRTVQGELAAAILRLGERARPVGAGRTDAGVHALQNVAHVELDRDWEEGELGGALGSLLPGDLTLLEVRRVGPSFHARHSAVSRTYHYALGLDHNPFFRERRWCPRTRPEPARAREELQSILGEHDFASFAKTGTETRTTLCRIRHAGWTGYPGGAVLSLVADRFLYGMVRAIVGALIQGAGEGPGHLGRVLARRERAAAGPAAPGAGLYLAGVAYPGESGAAPETDEVAGLAGLTAIRAGAAGYPPQSGER